MPRNNKTLVIFIDAASVVLLGLLNAYLCKKYASAIVEVLFPSYVQSKTLQDWTAQDAVVTGVILSIFLFGLFLGPLWAIHKFTDYRFGVKSEYK